MWNLKTVCLSHLGWQSQEANVSYWPPFYSSIIFAQVRQEGTESYSAVYFIPFFSIIREYYSFISPIFSYFYHICRYPQGLPDPYNFHIFLAIQMNRNRLSNNSYILSLSILNKFSLSRTYFFFQRITIRRIFENASNNQKLLV